MKKTKYLLLFVPVILSLVLIYLVVTTVIGPVKNKNESHQINTTYKDLETVLTEVETKVSEKIAGEIVPSLVHKEYEDSEKEAEEFVNIIVKEAIEEAKTKVDKKEESIIEKIKQFF
ncbi:hypothetical protein [Persephonella sp.]